MSIKRGALIVVEGVDRSGKSTQCRKLVESLNAKNIPSELFRFPDRSTSSGKLIGQYLTDKTIKLHNKSIHLLFSANRWENYNKMVNLITNGVTLIVDRYSYSGIAYSASKKGMDLEWCKSPEIGLPRPDLVFLLTLNNEEMLKRPGFGDERYENSQIQEKVLKIYKTLIDKSWEVVDASGNIEEVHNTLLNKILSTIDAVKYKDLESLNFESNLENDKNNLNVK